MIILTIRTDKPLAELCLYDGSRQLDRKEWQAHRQLAETLHRQIADMLEKNSITLQGLDGIACYKGPGSFTGLRIGLSVANALAYGLQVPVVAAGGSDWQNVAITRLMAGDDDPLALPEYGADVHITLPKQQTKH